MPNTTDISDNWLIINLDEQIVDTGEQTEQDNFFADFQKNSTYKDPFFDVYVPEDFQSVELFCGDRKPSLPPMRRSMSKKHPSFNTETLNCKEKALFFGSNDTISSPYFLNNKNNSKRLRKKLRKKRNCIFQTKNKNKSFKNEAPTCLFQTKNKNQPAIKNETPISTAPVSENNFQTIDWDLFMKNVDLDETIQPDYHPGIQNEILNAENEKIRILLAKIKKLDANDVQNLKNLRLMRDKLKIHLQFVADLCRSKNVKMVENKVYNAKKSEADAQKSFKKAKSERKMYKKLHNEYMKELKNTQRFQNFYNRLNKAVEHLEHEEKEKFFEEKAVEVFEYVKKLLGSF